MATTLIPWPTYTDRGGNSRQAEIQGSTIDLKYPGQRVVESEYTNNQYVFNVSPGEFRGSFVIRNSKRSTDFHVKVRNLMRQLKGNPHDNYTLVPWGQPSIATLASTLNPLSFWTLPNNNRCGSLIQAVGGVVLLELSTPAANETLVLSEGEHFSYNRRTYCITSATPAAGNNRWSVATEPFIANTTTTTGIFKRVFLPCRMDATHALTDSTRGSQVDSVLFPVIEARVN